MSSEVRGGQYSMHRAKRFAFVLEHCGLLDIGTTGNIFTWFRKAAGAQSISKRLDRALSDCAWRNLFPEAYVENLCHLHSYHCPLLLRCKAVVLEKKIRPFRFQAACLSHNPNIVCNAWLNGNHVVPSYLDKVRNEAIEINAKVFGNIFQRMKSL